MLDTQRAWHRLQSLCERITYKPGSKITVERGTNSGEIVFRVSLHIPVPDAKPPHAMTAITFSKFVSASDVSRMPEKWLVEYLFYELIGKFEQHESAEWFKLDGQHVHDPHPENSKVKA